MKTARSVLFFLFAILLFADIARCQSNAFVISSYPSSSKIYYDIDGNIVVWQDNRNKIPDQWGRLTWDIYGYDLITKQEFAICTQQNNQTSPAISGNYVVWGDERTRGSGVGDSIYGYNLSTNTEFAIQTGNAFSRPAINGNLVAWADSRYNIDDFGSSIFAHDLASSQTYLVHSAIIEDRYVMYNGFPAISGNTIVWKRHPSSQYSPPTEISSRIWIANVVTGSQFPVCPDPNWREQEFPAIDGNIVVWWHSFNPTWQRRGIYGYDLLTETEFLVSEISAINAGYCHPDISGNLVVWEENDSIGHGSYRIYGYDLLNQYQFLITESEGALGAPRISGNTVIWVGSDNVLYGTNIPEPATMVILTAGLLILSARKSKR
jgi:beta propeller repeat protein